MKYQTRN